MPVFVVALLVMGCNDLRDFRGPWEGPRVGESASVRLGASSTESARLLVQSIDTYGMAGLLSIDDLVADAPVSSITGAEADVLSGLTFAGAPLRVYLAFVAIADGRGEALAVIALFESQRIELRLLRGGSAPIYAIFTLRESSES
jgi:hypothetical protein